MRERRDMQTTLGDLIVAVTEEVDPLMNNPATTPVVVSYILQDLFQHHRVRLTRRSARRAGR